MSVKVAAMRKRAFILIFILLLIIGVAIVFFYLKGSPDEPKISNVVGQEMGYNPNTKWKQSSQLMGHRPRGSSRRKGGWHKIDSSRNPTLNNLAELQALGYMDGYESVPEFENVVTYIPGKTFDGLNLYISGHAPEAILMDMNGQILHKWTYSFSKAFPDYSQESSVFMSYWRKIHLFKNGDIIAIFEGLGMIKLDKDSNLIWSNPALIHHDLDIDDNGIIYTIARKQRMIPEFSKDEPVWEDLILVLEPDGTIIKEISVLKAFEESKYAGYLEPIDSGGDIFHTNSIEILPNQGVDFLAESKGKNFLISIRNINVIAVLTILNDVPEITWAISGPWRWQHHATLLKNGNILLYDNRGNGEYSKIIEIDPITQAIQWEYKGTPQNQFYSKFCGANQRLPNNNTLITESMSGHAFEVNHSGEIVWDFYNPERAGEDNELIATLFEMLRIEKDDASFLGFQPNMILTLKESPGPDNLQ